MTLLNNRREICAMELLFGKMILLLMIVVIGIFSFSTLTLALRDFIMYVMSRFSIKEELPDASMKASLLNPKYLESLKQRHLIDLKDIYTPTNQQKTDF